MGKITKNCNLILACRRGTRILPEVEPKFDIFSRFLLNNHCNSQFIFVISNLVRQLSDGIAQTSHRKSVDISTRDLLSLKN